MSRIPTPATIDGAPAASRPMLEATKKRLGSAPNVYRVVANSPAALEGLLGLSGALDKGALPPQTRERIALAVAEIDGSSYCLSAHSSNGKNIAKLDDSEISANRDGRSNDAKADAAVMFAATVARECGHSSDDDMRKGRAAGYDDAQIVEIVEHVALNVFTNYINLVAQTDIDFPVVTARKAA